MAEEVAQKPTKKLKSKIKKPSFTNRHVRAALSLVQVGAEVLSATVKKSRPYAKTVGSVAEVASAFLPDDANDLLGKLAELRKSIRNSEATPEPDKRQIRRIRLEMDVVIDLILKQHNLY
jgi:hypothetical protein